MKAMQDAGSASQTPHGISRRGFVKGGAVAAGLTALMAVGCAPKDEQEEEAGAVDEQQAPEQASDGQTAEEQVVEEPAPEEQHFQGLCRGNCGGGCRLDVTVREGKVVKTGPIYDEENPLENLICPRGYTHVQRMYAPERIEYPMRRVGERGSGEWERISWDEAIQTICDKWTEYRAEYGNSSILDSCGAGTYANNYYLYMRLFNSIGATKVEMSADMTMLNYSWRMFGMNLYLVGNSRKDEVNAHTIFVWGCNGTIGTFARWKYMMAARDNGARIVCIDPMYTITAQKADVWAPIKAGTDAALAMAMIKYWHDNGKEDQDYLRSMTVAPFLVRQDTRTFLRADEAGIDAEPEEAAATAGGFGIAGGEAQTVYPVIVVDEDGEAKPLSLATNPQIEATVEVNGIPCKTAYTMLVERCDEWTVEAAAKKTELSEDMIVQLAEMYLEGPTTLHTGFGIDHWNNGEGASHALLCLPIVSGQVGKNGAGMSGNIGGSTTGFAGDNWMTVVTSHYTPGMAVPYQDLYKISQDKTYNGMDITPKSWFVYAGNPLATCTGTSELRAFVDTLDLMITADTYWTDTANYSDIVLPVPHWFEYETYRTCPTDFLDFNDEAVPPQFECKTDAEIISLIGLGLDLGEEFDFTNDSIHAQFLDSEMSQQMGVSWDVLKEAKHIQMAPPDYNYGSPEIPWGTATGRAEFFMENPMPQYNQSVQLDQELFNLPFQSEPLEAYDDNPLREKYPINLISHRDKLKVHTAFATSPWLLEIQPEPTIELNPEDASKYGVAEGDYVKAFNDRGHVVLKAHLDASMRPGMAWTEHTWYSNQYKSGFYPDLTSTACEYFYTGLTQFDTLVAIEKWNEEA